MRNNILSILKNKKRMKRNTKAFLKIFCFQGNLIKLIIKTELKGKAAMLSRPKYAAFFSYRLITFLFSCTATVFPRK